MTTKHKQILYIGLSTVLGLALAVSVVFHFLISALETWQDWTMALLWLSGLYIGLIYLAITRLIGLIPPYVVHTRLLLIVLSLIVSGLLLVDGG
ncbi:MAG: hypothetical protein L0Y56_17355, partial [Nitrospira sp.]|nr:hypothetical protein [Nitrospira sp.]